MGDQRSFTILWSGITTRRLQQAIEIAESRANLIVFTGGLGPTKDDLTKEMIARHIGEKLVFNDEALRTIEAYFQKTGTADDGKQQKAGPRLRRQRSVRKRSWHGPRNGFVQIRLHIAPAWSAK